MVGNPFHNVCTFIARYIHAWVILLKNDGYTLFIITCNNDVAKPRRHVEVEDGTKQFGFGYIAIIQMIIVTGLIIVTNNFFTNIL